MMEGSMAAVMLPFSCWATLLRQPVGDHIKRRCDGEAQDPHFIRDAEQIRHHDHWHPGGMGSAHAVVTILKRQTVTRRNT